jgi:pilus assembly protein Flp/PilA
MFRLRTRTKLESAERSRWGGQALVEYALILALLAIAAGVTLAMTGPAIGNVFCNVVHNVGGDTVNFRDGATCGGGDAPDLAAEGGRDDLFWGTVTWIAQNPQKETPFNND